VVVRGAQRARERRNLISRTPPVRHFHPLATAPVSCERFRRYTVGLYGSSGMKRMSGYGGLLLSTAQGMSTAKTLLAGSAGKPRRSS
jgi:hypothetical protein